MRCLKCLRTTSVYYYCFSQARSSGVADFKSKVSIWRMPDIDNTVSVHQYCVLTQPYEGIKETTALFYASGCRPLQVKEWLLKEVNIPVLTFFNQWLGGSNDVGGFMDLCHDDMMLPLIDGFIYLCWQHIRQGKHLERCHQAYRVAQSIRQEKTSSIVMNASLLKQRWCHELAHLIGGHQYVKV